MHAVGIAGMGNMGRRMAARLASRGVDVAIWNRSTPDLPHPMFETPAALAAHCAVVLVMVRDIEASRAVWLGPDGIAAGAGPRTICIEASTVTAAWTAELAPTVARFLEGPVVGTLPHAERGQLTMLLGGDRTDAAVAIEALEPLGKRVYVGPRGHAMGLKLAINTLFATEVAALVEVLSLLRGVGMQTDAALDFLSATPVFPPVLGGIVTLLKAGDDAPRFPIRLVEKDLGYASPGLPLVEAVRSRYDDAIQAGLGDLNIHGLHHLSAGTSAAPR